MTPVKRIKIYHRRMKLEASDYCQRDLVIFSKNCKQDYRDNRNHASFFMECVI